jgi:hypothetical protein
VIRRKGQKYRNEITVVNGVKFRSKLEAKRYSELLLLQQAGEISCLRLQPRFPIIINGTKCFTYVSDFEYLKRGEDVLTIEDAKGFWPQESKNKFKSAKASYPEKRFTVWPERDIFKKKKKNSGK